MYAKNWVLYQFCMRVHVPDMFLSFEFQKDRKKNVRAVGGRNFPSPIEMAHRLYKQLFATAQAVTTDEMIR